MPSDLQVDNIKDASATKTLATLSSSAVTLHSDVSFPSGTPTKFEKSTTVISSAQSLTRSYADITGTSITYTPASGASFIVYETSFLVSGAGDTSPPLIALRFMVDGSITKNQDSYLFFADGATSGWINMRSTHKMIYSASGWTSNKVVKMQARNAYQSNFRGKFHNNDYDYLTTDGQDLGNTDRLTDVETTIFSVM